VTDRERPFFSVIITTCREDYPMPKRRDTHVLALMAENCIRQTYGSFELIVVDLLYKDRAGWLEENYGMMPFPILHVPDKSSVFRDLRLTRICAARNTGLLYARGHCVIFSDDCQEWSDNALERLHDWGSNDVGATVRLHRDRGKGPYEADSRWEAYSIQGTLKTKVVNAAGIGFLGGTLSMVPLEKMLECNGWDEMFDGSRQLEDSDMARRLGATELRMALEGHAKCVEFTHGPCGGDIHRSNANAKCNGAYIYPIWEAQPNRIVANDRILTDEELDLFMPGECPWLEHGNCKSSGDKCEARWNRRSLMNIYKDPRLVFDLRQMRSQRDWETARHDPLLQV
jgi:glycosyltransferase involved in cell wall biosynthesis